MSPPLDVFQIRDGADALLRSVNGGAIVDLTPTTGGGNNRGFIVETPKDRFFLKVYFRDHADPRDRLDTEFRFSQYAWIQGIRTVPEPLALDRVLGLGLYRFVEGRQLSSSEVSSNRVDASLDFWLRLNVDRTSSKALGLPIASEACFSIKDHLACVDRRLARLSNVQPVSQIDAEAVAFIGDELTRVWRRVGDQFRAQFSRLHLDADEPLPMNQRCLSPSDFGFHNTILTRDGSLVFIDFEYAGWDHPIKVVCDFFCQPRIPAPLEFVDRFLQTFVGTFGLSPDHVECARNLLPVYRVKWCCIMLNEFLALGARRRQFSGTAQDLEAHKSSQLERARKTLESLAEA